MEKSQLSLKKGGFDYVGGIRLLKIEVISSWQIIFYSGIKNDFLKSSFLHDFSIFFSLFFFKPTLRFLKRLKIAVLMTLWGRRPSISVRRVENNFRGDRNLAPIGPVDLEVSYATQCRNGRLRPVLSHQEAYRKALYHSRMTEPLRRAATVSLCPVAARRSGSDILVCSSAFDRRSVPSTLSTSRVA